MRLSPVLPFASLLFISTTAIAQHKCLINGKTVFQETPCARQEATPTGQVTTGKYRCFIDGVVIYSAQPCSTIKTKAMIELEAKQAKTADLEKRLAAARKLSAEDKPNHEYRLIRGRRAAANRLREPGSAQFDQVFISYVSGFPVVCGSVAGKNGFGGYANAARFFAIDTLATFDEGKPYQQFDDQWEKYCIPSMVE